jgi:hypothetical protein
MEHRRDGAPEADRFPRVHDGSGTQRTYTYLLVDHLRWLERECLSLDKVVLRDLISSATWASFRVGQLVDAANVGPSGYQPR